MRALVLSVVLIGCTAEAQGLAGWSCMDDATQGNACGAFYRVASGPSDAGYPCDFSPAACNAGNNLLASGDLADGSWSAYGSGTAAPTVSALASTTIDGQTVSYNRVQFAAVAGGQESTVYANVSSGACKKITCTYSIYLKAHDGVSTGNLPIGAASGGGDGQNYQMCPFTGTWSRCDLTVVSAVSHSFSYYWIGYVASQSGTSGALDLDLAGPKAEYGQGGATAYQCPSPLQNSAALPHTGYVQATLTADWGINSRDGAGLVKVADGTLVVLGGWKGAPQAEWGNHVTTNQVYKSADDGVTWTEVLAHVDDPAQTTGECLGGGTCTAGNCVGGTCNLLACGTGACAPRWRRRHSHCAFTATISGTEYIYVVGADGFDDYYNHTADGVPPYPADVWRSVASTYGATWTLMTATAGFGNTTPAPDNDGGLNGRVLHMCWADDSGNIYVAGGQTNLTSSTLLRDVWKSTNGGTSFTSLGNAPWTGRGTLASPLPRLNGKTYLYGGEVYDTNAPDRIYRNDVWSFDDTNWSSIQPDAGWTPRGYHNLVSWKSRIWMLKGYPGENHADIWSAAEPGACWRQERAVAGSAEHAASVAVSADAGSLIFTGSSTGLYVGALRAP